MIVPVRECRNCKFWKSDDKTDPYADCTNVELGNKVGAYMAYFVTDADFGCNLWEPKYIYVIKGE